MEFLGYRRENGDTGVRNHVVVLPTIGCANEMAHRIANHVPGAIALLHNHACIRLGEDAQRARKTLIGMGSNPNVHSVLVVGLGCEPVKPDELAQEIAKTGKDVQYVALEQAGKYERLIEQGVQILQSMVLSAEKQKRQVCRVSDLTIGIKCGGSGAVSAIASNPAVGRAADLLIGEGATVIFTETAELIGAETVLAARANTPEVGACLLGCVRKMEDEIKRYGVDILGSEPTQGNIKNGLTTIEEKSLGAIVKGGTTPLMGVVEYGQRPAGHGLYFMDGTTQASQLFLGMFCAGAQIQLFSYAGGLPARFRALPSYPCGLRTLPVLKVLGSCADEDEKEYFDVYAGGILNRGETVGEVGKHLFEEIIETAAGKQSITERNTSYSEMLQIYANGLLM